MCPTLISECTRLNCYFLYSFINFYKFLLTVVLPSINHLTIFYSFLFKYTFSHI
nr:MAG TPA: hypothetical protein [Caudoviricetes sp.]